MQATKTDAEIQLLVLNELRRDTRVRATEVGVAVGDGIVTLSGSVDSYGKKLVAREATHRVAGVLDVADEIEVAIPTAATRTDTEIAEAVRRALTWDVIVPDERIQSTVSRGWVTLRGQVDRWTHRTDAAAAVRNLQGVRGVTSEIQVIASRVDPQAVRKAIADALERQVQREADQITIQVTDGTVTLPGWVRDWAEEREIIQAASHAPGIRSVKNDLHIDALSR